MSNYSKPFDSYIFPRVNKKVRNRSVLAAMTNKQSHSDGVLSDREIKWLTRRAKDGFGIITTAATHVSKYGQGWEGEFGIFDDLFIDKLKVLTKNIHQHDCLIFAQLFHGGMRAPEKLTGKTPISASRIPCEQSSTGFTISAKEKEIKQLINDFQSAALRSVEAGFDGIELHGAHGYLISQFLGEKTNLRDDNWGGNISGRSKFLVTIISEIKKVVPESFIVGVRMSPEIKELGIYLNDSLKLARILSKTGIDFIHLSCWDCFKTSSEHLSDKRTLTEWFIQSISNLPTIISTGGIWSTKDANNVIKQGADLIGVGRAAIPYPDWGANLNYEKYDPPKMPFSTEQLLKAGLSDIFIDYMRNWKGFIKDE